MKGFFEIILREKSRFPLLAAWVVEGESSGARALFAWKDGQYVRLYRDDAFPEALAGTIGAFDRSREGALTVDGVRVFLERISGEKRLVVCGAGHVALCVIRLAAALGYDVTVIEDRAEYAEKASGAGAHRVLCKPFGEALDAVEGGPGTAYVVMTREHEHDVDCLRRILLKPCAYTGVMGSRSRASQIRQQLLEEGFAPERLREMHMPVGLGIGARTPEEIAVSVMAELIAVMNARDTSEGFPPGMLEALCRETGGVLAMIVEKRGEAPRRPGTKMLVRPDGSFLGTIGGGFAEAAVLRAAGELLRQDRRETRSLPVSMKKGVMYCGGEIEVLLLPL